MKIIIQPNAKKDLKALPKKDIKIILKKLHSIEDEPLRYIERLRNLNLWKLKINDYRAIIYVDTKAEIIHILKLGHRKEIYKKISVLEWKT